ncbi:MAG: rod shape-determining protein MreD [Prevotellaceae bacterium]|jgi:rod shape-determining protein MreD|nr:rod shape-determining protein MreD [Prevotellaceae bacterium]
MSKTQKSLLFAVALVAAQILLFNSVQLRGMLNSFVAPCIYILYIFALPMGISRVHLLITSFTLGLTVDLLSGTLGLNAAACVLVGFIRPSALKLFVSREDVNKGTRPSIYTLKFFNFSFYAFMLAFIFHLALFFLEIFTLYGAHLTLLRALLSAAAAVAIMMILEIFFAKKDKPYR